MQVSRWGNSLAVRLPAKLVEQMGLKEGDEVELRAADERTLEIERDRRLDEAMARLRALAVPLPPGYKFNREELYERGRDDEP